MISHSFRGIFLWICNTWVALKKDDYADYFCYFFRALTSLSRWTLFATVRVSPIPSWHSNQFHCLFPHVSFTFPLRILTEHVDTLVMFLGGCHVTLSNIIFIPYFLPVHPILFHYDIAFISWYILVMLYCSRSTSPFIPWTSLISRKKQRSDSSSPLYCTYSTCPRIVSRSVFVSLGTANTPLSFHTTAARPHLHGVSIPTENHCSSHQLDSLSFQEYRDNFRDNFRRWPSPPP